MDNKDIIILKIGGSIVTNKNTQKAQLNDPVVKRLSKELKLFIKHHPKTKIILLHGAGSFGHPLVYKFKLLNQSLTRSSLLKFDEVICSMRQLSNLLTINFLKEKIPVFPVQTSALFYEKNNNIKLANISYLKQIIDTGFIPMLGGDLGINQNNRTIVISADKLAVILAKAFSTSRIIFASDVDGIFKNFPPASNEKPLASINRKKIKEIVKNINGYKNQCDVTGEMAGKLKSVLALKKKEITIFNGLKPGELTKALNEKPTGTELIL